MSNTKQDYKKQKLDLFQSEFNREELCNLIIEARKQRDYYKINLKVSSKKNSSFKREFLKQEKMIREEAKRIQKSLSPLGEMLQQERIAKDYKEKKGGSK